MGSWVFTLMLPVLLLRLTGLLKSSIWSSKDCGSHNLFQTCPKTAFLFACLRSCFPLPVPTGVETRLAQQHEKWELGLNPRSQAQSRSIQRAYKDQSWLVSSFNPTEQQLIQNPTNYHILGNSKCLLSAAMTGFHSCDQNDSKKADCRPKRGSKKAANHDRQ